jgi:hypothetical protein
METKGAIGFDIQELVLDKTKSMLPENFKVLLTADRFYGTKNLVEWCQKAGWDYRVRLKGNLIFEHDGGEITAEDVGKLPGSKAIGAKFHKSDISTNIGFLHEKGHEEPWIIAMNCDPSEYKILDYGMRWGIECMFSDFKSRGFGITKTHLRHPDRIERLILILSIALYWAVSIGKTAEDPSQLYSEKKKKMSKLSCLTKGLRFIAHMIINTYIFHELWPCFNLLL